MYVYIYIRRKRISTAIFAKSSFAHDDVTWNLFSHSWPHVWRVHRSEVDSHHKLEILWSFDVFFDVNLNKLLSKRSNRRQRMMTVSRCDMNKAGDTATAQAISYELTDWSLKKSGGHFLDGTCIFYWQIYCLKATNHYLNQWSFEIIGIHSSAIFQEIHNICRQNLSFEINFYFFYVSAK